MTEMQDLAAMQDFELLLMNDMYLVVHSLINMRGSLGGTADRAAMQDESDFSDSDDSPLPGPATTAVDVVDEGDIKTFVSRRCIPLLLKRAQTVRKKCLKLQDYRRTKLHQTLSVFHPWLRGLTDEDLAAYFGTNGGALPVSEEEDLYKPFLSLFSDTDDRLTEEDNTKIVQYYETYRLLVQRAGTSDAWYWRAASAYYDETKTSTAMLFTSRDALALPKDETSIFLNEVFAHSYFTPPVVCSLPQEVFTAETRFYNNLPAQNVYTLGFPGTETLEDMQPSENAFNKYKEYSKKISCANAATYASTGLLQHAMAMKAATETLEDMQPSENAFNEYKEYSKKISSANAATYASTGLLQHAMAMEAAKNDKHPVNNSCSIFDILPLALSGIRKMSQSTTDEDSAASDTVPVYAQSVLEAVRLLQDKPVLKGFLDTPPRVYITTSSATEAMKNVVNECNKLLASAFNGLSLNNGTECMQLCLASLTKSAYCHSVGSFPPLDNLADASKEILSNRSSILCSVEDGKSIPRWLHRESCGTFFEDSNNKGSCGTHSRKAQYEKMMKEKTRPEIESIREEFKKSTDSVRMSQNPYMELKKLCSVNYSEKLGYRPWDLHGCYLLSLTSSFFYTAYCIAKNTEAHPVQITLLFKVAAAFHKQLVVEAESIYKARLSEPVSLICFQDADKPNIPPVPDEQTDVSDIMALADYFSTFARSSTGLRWEATTGLVTTRSPYYNLTLEAALREAGGTTKTFTVFEWLKLARTKGPKKDQMRIYNDACIEVDSGNGQKTVYKHTRQLHSRYFFESLVVTDTDVGYFDDNKVPASHETTYHAPFFENAFRKSLKKGFATYVKEKGTEEEIDVNLFLGCIARSSFDTLPLYEMSNLDHTSLTSGEVAALLTWHEFNTVTEDNLLAYKNTHQSIKEFREDAGSDGSGRQRDAQRMSVTVPSLTRGAVSLLHIVPPADRTDAIYEYTQVGNRTENEEESNERKKKGYLYFSKDNSSAPVRSVDSLDRSELFNEQVEAGDVFVYVLTKIKETLEGFKNDFSNHIDTLKDNGLLGTALHLSIASYHLRTTLAIKKLEQIMRDSQRAQGNRIPRDVKELGYMWLRPFGIGEVLNEEVEKALQNKSDRGSVYFMSTGRLVDDTSQLVTNSETYSCVVNPIQTPFVPQKTLMDWVETPGFDSRLFVYLANQGATKRTFAALGFFFPNSSGTAAPPDPMQVCALTVLLEMKKLLVAVPLKPLIPFW